MVYSTVVSFFFFGAYALWYAAIYGILRSVPVTYNPYTALFLRGLVGTLCVLFSTICPANYFSSYFIFLCASCLVIYTDSVSMLIARTTSIYLVPLAWLLAYHGFFYISFVDSISGTLLGILILGLTQKISTYYYKQPGLGTGDIDYIALAGAFTGILGVWLTILLGSFLASLWAVSLMLKGTFTRTTPFAFGTFLALAGILVLLFKYEIAALLM